MSSGDSSLPGYGQPGTTIDSGHREIADEIYEIKECIIKSPIDEPREDEMLDWYDAGEPLHSSQTAYLINGDKTLLFDTLSPAGEEYIVSHLQELIDGELDYLVISHPEANHAGNTGAILNEYPEATLVAPKRGAQHSLFGLTDETTFVSPGDTIDLGTHTAEFCMPLFYDHAMSTWMMEKDTETLFTVDWFGAEHMGGDCLHYADQLENKLTANQLERFTGYAFVWLRFVDPEKTDEAIEYIRHELSPKLIAPAHGQVVRNDVDKQLKKMKEIIRGISEDPSPPRIHTHEMVRYGRTETEF